jgi:hypothetical protein
MIQQETNLSQATELPQPKNETRTQANHVIVMNKSN